jgi:hypothetical protein
MESLAIKAQRDAGKATPLVKKREPEWYERFHWFESSEGFLVLAGRDASTNEVLINRYTEEEDIVFHAEIQGAPFVTIKTGGRLPGDETLLEAAEAAASYSKAWSSGFTSADVYWVNAGQLSKKPPSGQYLGRGMFMVYGQRNYMKPIPLRVAVGIIANENELKLISGPRAAVENRTSYFVELVPGKTRSGELAKRIIHKLSKKVSESVAKTIKNLTLDEIQRMIPAGTGDIVE